MDKKQVFISHAEKDKSLVEKFVDLLITGGGLHLEDIFCTSLEGMDIPVGENFIDFIKSKITNPSIVVLVLSPNYYDSVFCLCELGATWVLSPSTFPIVVPPLTFNEIRATLAVTELGMMDNGATLDALFDRLVKLYSLTPNTRRWNVKRDQFLKEIHSVIDELPKANKITIKVHQDLQQNYEQSIETLNELEKEIKKQAQVIEALKNVKDSTEVSRIFLEHSTEWEKFDTLVGIAKGKLQELDDIVCEAIYFGQKNQGLIIDIHWEDASYKRISADQAVDNGYLEWHEDEGYSPNYQDKSVKETLDSIQHLQNFLESTSSMFDDQFYETNSYRPSLSNKRFWRDFLDLND